MTPSAAKENRERAEIMKDEARLRDQERASTMFEHAVSSANDETGGRYSAIGKQRVVGSTPMAATIYPAASAAHQVQLPPEPPLGIDINAMPDLASPTGLASPVVTGPTSDAPSPLMVEGDVPRSDVGPSSSEEQTK
jgi:hypothetical protein